MIRRGGPQRWKNIHVTFATDLADLIDVDNSVTEGERPTRFGLLRQAARDLDALAKEASCQGQTIRALGAGWALSDIAVTTGWLVNTKPLNGCFDVSDRYFETTYPKAKRPYVVVAQCGMSIGELNVHLEVTATCGFPRALKTSGIGAGQTIAGAVSGNTHGSAVNFGATPDFVVGLQVVTGSGTSLWIEPATAPVFNDDFVAALGARRIRDDDVFHAAIVSFGAFGIITAVAIETDPIYQLDFPPVQDVRHDVLQDRLRNFNDDDPKGLYHYEFAFNPYSKMQKAMVACAPRVPYEPGHCGLPQPVWIVRDKNGYAFGDKVAPVLLATGDWSTPYALFLGLTPARWRADVQFDQYRKRAILGNVRSTPGQLFTATVTYYEGYTESAIGVGIADAASTMEISIRVIRDMKLPAVSQVRIVKKSEALLGFTSLGPKTVVFEFGLAHDRSFVRFEDALVRALNAAGIRYAFHWSKNSGIEPGRLKEMYDRDDRIDRWRRARAWVFDGNARLMRVFDNDHLRRAGLA